jgi:hypothetical protein
LAFAQLQAQTTNSLNTVRISLIMSLIRAAVVTTAISAQASWIQWLTATHVASVQTHAPITGTNLAVSS